MSDLAAPAQQCEPTASYALTRVSLRLSLVSRQHNTATRTHTRARTPCKPSGAGVGDPTQMIESQEPTGPPLPQRDLRQCEQQRISIASTLKEKVVIFSIHFHV